MAALFPYDERRARDTYPFHRLLAPIGGLMETVGTMLPEPTAPDFPIAVTSLGNVTNIFSHVSTGGKDARNEPLGGAGADPDEQLCWIRALVEGAERYASMAYRKEDFIVASANELGRVALDLESVPRCSPREYADPHCPFKPADKNEPIRWCRGWSLLDQCERYVPAVMTCLFLKPWSSEMFWQMISTGMAAHTNLTKALVSAICESVERDAIALTWLCRLPLRRIELDDYLPPELRPFQHRVERSMLRHLAFDATTDLKVPTIYAVQLMENQPRLAQYVNCATGFDAAQLYMKTIREAAPARAVFQLPMDMPDELEAFTSLYDGAMWHGRPSQRAQFDFLVKSPRRTTLGAVNGPSLSGDQAQLDYLIDRLKAMKMDAVVVDLTPQELRAVGLWVVRVVIPGLVPMGTIQRGRFLGHPRIYSYPEQLGLGKFREKDINPAPQPFA